MFVTSATRLGTAVAALSLVAVGCSSKATETADSSSGIKTGPGVSADTITLGALTDLSGVFGAQGKIIVQGNQLYLDKINAAGGICDRKVELVVKDHGTDVQKAVSLYAETEPEVLGYVQMLGSPITSALDTDITDARTLTVATAWSSTLLKNPEMIVMGNTYDVETVNGVDHLAKEEGLKSGDVLGHIYFEGDYGNSALQGSTYAAGKLGLKLEGIQVKATDTDLTAQVTTLKSRGAKAVVLSVGPRQTASVAGVAASLGYDVPLLANTPAFDPSLLSTSAKSALEKNLSVMTSIAPFSSTEKGPREVAAALPEKFPDTQPNSFVNLGYASALVYAEVLEKACANGDLTREGVNAAFRQLKNVDTGGLTSALDFSATGRQPSRQTYVTKVDSSVPGGLALQGPATESETAEGYTSAG
ncbi:ABC transporter substrate-binding protein [Streptomyces geranii]|uniref:ABC transporter substrate-binding protein n=1 Tax=Streptomyces geranii TaxID=2058923 RepID=UPI000D046542|nr:ABC transporter substrate-binding protein [Streptomyces geranii]